MKMIEQDYPKLRMLTLLMGPFGTGKTRFRYEARNRAAKLNLPGYKVLIQNEWNDRPWEHTRNYWCEYSNPETHFDEQGLLGLADEMVKEAFVEHRHILAETRSKLIFDRIRRRIAEAPMKEAREMAANFIVRWKAHPRLPAVWITCNEYGAVKDWPDGFCDEDMKESEAILTAAMAKRMKAEEVKKS